MHYVHSRPRLTARHRLQLALPALAIAALAAIAPAAAHAQSAATVSSTQSLGMRYTGTSGPDNVRVTLAGTTFTVDDSGPIQPGTGCSPVAGDPTKATCVAFKVGLSFKKFQVSLRDGADTVKNLTGGAGAPAAGMVAEGGAGNDELDGSAHAADELRGDSGNDDLRDLGGFKNVLSGGTGNDGLYGGASIDTLNGASGDDDLNGGGGADQLDGGVGADIIDGGGPAGALDSGEFQDVVDYSDRLANVTVDLRRTDDSQGVTGDPGERDTIRDVEIVLGGAGNDVLFGDDDNETLIGGAGRDFLVGRSGRDTLVGQAGDDTLIGSVVDNFFGVFPDGQADVMDCGGLGASDGGPGDTAFRVIADNDFVNDCAKVIDV